MNRILDGDQMKRIKAIVLAILLLFSLSGCTFSKTEKKNSSLTETTLGGIAGIINVLGTSQSRNGSLLVYAQKEDGKTVLCISDDQGASWQFSESESVTTLNEAIPENAMVIQGDVTAEGEPVVCYQESQNGKNIFHIAYLKNEEAVTFTEQTAQHIYGMKYENGGREIFLNCGDVIKRYDTDGQCVQEYEQKGIIDFLVEQDEIILITADGLSYYDRDNAQKEGTLPFPKGRKAELSKIKKEQENVLGSSSHILLSGQDERTYFILHSGIYRCEKKSIKRIVNGSHFQFSSEADGLSGGFIENGKKMRVLLQENRALQTYAYTEEKDAPEEVEQQVSVSEKDPDHPKGVMYKDGRYNLFVNYISSYQAKKDRKKKGTITVYSLYPDEELEEIIRVYQIYRPNVSVKLEVGVEKKSNITSAQAIEKLNSRMLSHNGPDVLFLDGMDDANYVENGLLKDLSDVYETIKKEQSLFTNITDAYKKEGHIYALPTHFIPSFLIGKKDVVQKSESLDDLVQMVAEDKTTWGNALDMYTAKQLFETLYPSCSNLIFKNNRSYQEVEYKAFAEKMKQIYTLLKEQDKKNNAKDIWNDYKEHLAGNLDSDQSTALHLRGLCVPDVSNRCIGVSMLYFTTDFYWPLLACRENKEFIYEAIPWGEKNVYQPRFVAAINQETKKEELAEDFLKQLFAPEEQYVNMGEKVTAGCPVNREALRISIAQLNCILDVDIAGKEKVLYESFQSQKEYDTFLQYLQSFQTAAYDNEQLENVLLKGLEDYLEDKITLDDYLDGVKKRMQVYQSE